MDMTLDEAVNIFKKFNADLPNEFRISKQDIFNGDVRKLKKARGILAVNYPSDMNSSLELAYKVLEREAKSYKEIKKMSSIEEVIRKAEEKRSKDDEDRIKREAEEANNKAREERRKWEEEIRKNREAYEARRKAEAEEAAEKFKQEEARRVAEEDRIRREAETNEKEQKDYFEETNDFEEKVANMEKQREQGPVQKVINLLTGKSTQGGAISKAELQKIVKRIRKKKLKQIKDDEQRLKYQRLLDDIDRNKRYGIRGGGRFNESNSIECFNKLMELETSIDKVLMDQELSEIEKSPIIRPNYIGTSTPKDEGPIITPQPRKPLQLGPKTGEYVPIIRPNYIGTSTPKDEGPIITPQPRKPLQLGPGQEIPEPSPEPSPEPEKKEKTQKTKIPWIPLMQFFAFLLGIFLLLFTPYWIFGLPLVIAGILLLLGVQSEREGLRELFDWFLHDDTGNKWGMVLVVGIGSLIIYFKLGPIIAAIPLIVIFTYFAFGKKVVSGDGESHFVEYVLGLSGATIVLYYFFGYYIAAIPLLLVIVVKILGKTALGEHFTEFIMTGTGIVLFIGGAQYAASYLYITFSWPLLAGFGVFNAVILVVLWSMEEGGKDNELVKAQIDEAKANEAAAEEQKKFTEEERERIREERNIEKPKPNYESAGAGLQQMEEYIAKPKKKVAETEE